MIKPKSFVGMTLISLLLSACHDEAITNGTSEAVGKLALTVHVDREIQSSTTVTDSRADDGGIEAEAITRNDLTLAITSQKTGGTIYYSLATFDEGTVFPVGTYDISAFYGDYENEGFGHPYYYGIAKDIAISKDKTTPVNLKAELSNSMFTIKYTDKLKNYLAEYCALLKSQAGSEVIEYPADATRRVYMQTGSVDISIFLKKKNGIESTVKVATVNAEARHHYGITLDVTGDTDTENGASLTIEFDDQLDGEETIEISLDDAALEVAAPTVTPEGFDPENAITHTEGAIYSQDLLFNIYAPGKIDKINLVTTNYERINGWPASIDLAHATAEQQETLKSLGLDALGVWKNPDQMARINLKDVLQHIELLTGAAEVDFALTVVDNNGKQSETSTLKVLVEPFVVQMELSNPQPATLALGQSTLTAEATYNGKDITHNVKVQYNDEGGVWYDATATFTPGAADEQYTVAVSDLPATGDLQLRLQYTTGETSNPVEVTRSYPSVALTVDPADVWAHNATIKVLATDGTSVLRYASSTVGVKVSTNGTDFTSLTKNLVSGDYITINDLAPGTKYYVKVTLSGKDDDLSDAAEFTTESALQLPNNGMEDWYTVNGDTQYWWIEYPGTDSNTVWGTMNLLTTSDGGDRTGNLDAKRNGLSYNAFSGTRKTTDSHSGNAAIIETVGWGAGNTAAGTGASICKNVTAGELYLGNYNSSTKTPNYNYAFASRPTSVSFWYKYRAKNSDDYGCAEVQVLDASGNVIATQNMKLTSKDYTQAILSLDYTIKAKAANLHIVFRSTGNSDALQWKTSWMDGPGFGDKDGRFVGSSLYIDDITLNY